MKKIIFIIILICVLILCIFIFKISQVQGVSKEEIINGKIYSTVEYADLKTDLVSKVSNRKTTPISFSDSEDWKIVVDTEIKKCGSWSLTNVTTDNLIDKLNDKLNSNKC